MSDVHKKLLAKYKGDLKLPGTPLSFTKNCSNKIITLMTDEDKVLKDVKKAIEEGRPLKRFEAYLKTFQRDNLVKVGLLFNVNKLIVPAALRLPFMSLLHETHPVRNEISGRKHLVATFIKRDLLIWEKLYPEYQGG